ncbi:MAG: ABC transporter ATP-binding protein [Thermosynechococcaceae cyanobacterium]
MEHCAVELINLCKNYKGANQRALNRINLRIKAGEFFSLLGPSGCGKTTTLRIIAGFETPTSGDIYIQGVSMGDRPPFQRPVNTVFQHYALFPHLTVAQNIAFGLEMDQVPRAEIRQRVGLSLAQVRLEGMESRYPRQLSGGQQQRVALARALVKQPQVLLFDEPLGALDLKLRKEMQFELKRMQQQLGITFIYVTHDQEEALTMSDRIAVMHKGCIQQIGSPLDIYEHPTTRFVADFIGESNFLTGKVIRKDRERVVVLVDEALSVQVALSPETELTQSRVTLVLRPEKLTLQPFDPEGSSPQRINQWVGRIEEVIYVGTDTRYVIRLSDRIQIVVRLQNLHPEAVQQYRPNTEVLVSITPECLRILDEDDPEEMNRRAIEGEFQLDPIAAVYS